MVKAVQRFTAAPDSSHTQTRPGRLNSLIVLYAPRGLKDLVGLEDLTDEELAAQQEDKADLLGLITPLQWSWVRKAGLRAEVLDTAELSGWVGVEAFLNCLHDGFEKPKI